MWKSSQFFSFINQSQRIWSCFQKIQVSFTFQKSIKYQLPSLRYKQETDFPLRNSNSYSLWFDFWLMGKTKIKVIFGSFWNRYTHRPFLVSPWCMLECMFSSVTVTDSWTKCTIFKLAILVSKTKISPERNWNKKKLTTKKCYL